MRNPDLLPPDVQDIRKKSLELWATIFQALDKRYGSRKVLDYEAQLDTAFTAVRMAREEIEQSKDVDGPPPGGPMVPPVIGPF